MAKAAVIEDLETQREVAACVCNLSLSDVAKLPIAQSGVLRPLIKLCQSADVEVARQACGACGNIAEDPSTHSS